MRSREVIDIIADVVSETSKDCKITIGGHTKSPKMVDCPKIHYIFGNAQYVKDRLDEFSKSAVGNVSKFPLIVLFCPFSEDRNNPNYHNQAKVNILVVVSSMLEWSNEQREKYSFENILRPIYRNFLKALKRDGRISIDYNGVISHKYSENYVYGRYGAWTTSGEKVSEPIDAICISDLKLNIKLSNCREK